MKRDNDLIRELLHEFEAKKDFLVVLPNYMSMPKHLRQKQYHMYLLSDAGFITPVGRGTYRLTNAGHDFLDAMRDEGIWQSTKDAIAQTGGNATLEMVKQIAVGFLKKSIRDKTGIDL
ncbi:MAG: DUF2513 domain-containing protein [Pararhodobacter sp.]|nr:DUF2513 domain-containing protein [Pararhodobacter sp.]